MINVFEILAQAHFHSEPEPLLQFPHYLRQNEPLQGGFGGSVESHGEAVFGKAGGEGLWILPESQAAYVIESEPKQKVLEINRLILFLRRSKDGAEPELDGSAHPARHGLAQSAGGEFQSGGLALEQPRVAVGIEDAVAEQIMKHSLPGRSLGVISEPELENVLQVLGVARDGHEALFPREEGNSADAGLVSAAAGSEVLRNPIVHAIAVLD